MSLDQYEAPSPNDFIEKFSEMVRKFFAKKLLDHPSSVSLTELVEDFFVFAFMEDLLDTYKKQHSEDEKVRFKLFLFWSLRSYWWYRMVIPLK